MMNVKQYSWMLNYILLEYLEIVKLPKTISVSCIKFQETLIKRSATAVRKIFKAHAVSVLFYYQASQSRNIV